MNTCQLHVGIWLCIYAKYIYTHISVSFLFFLFFAFEAHVQSHGNSMDTLWLVAIDPAFEPENGHPLHVGIPDLGLPEVDSLGSDLLGL